MYDNQPNGVLPTKADIFSNKTQDGTETPSGMYLIYMVDDGTSVINVTGVARLRYTDQ